jgi:hypothetical protein
MKYGMVVTFETKEDAEKARKLLAKEKLVEIKPPRKIGKLKFPSTPTIHEFDPDWGSPVWYIP